MSWCNLVMRYASSLLVPQLAERGTMAGLYPVIAVIGARHKWTDLSTGAVMALAGAGRVIGVIPAALMLPLTGLAGTQVVGCAIVSLAFFVWYAGLLELFIGDETNASKVGVCTVATMIGLGTGVLASGRQPFLYHAAPSEWLGRLSAIFGGCARWAQMLGPLVVGAAMQQWPGNPYIGITALAGLMSVAVVSLAVGWSTILELQASVAARAVQTKEVHEEDEGRCCTAALSSAFAHVDGKPLVVVMLVALVLGTLRGARSMLIPVVALRHHYSAAATTVAVSASYSVDATLFWVAGWVLDHHGPRWSLLPTCALFALSSLVLAWIDEASPVALFATCILTMGLAESFSCGLINTLIGRVVPADSGPTPYVILRALPDGANVVGPLIAGVTLSATGGSIAATAYALTVVAGLGIIICFTAPVMSTTSTTNYRPLK